MLTREPTDAANRRPVSHLNDERAAVLESRRLLGDGTLVAVHSGFWGCGAFGGNRTLMAMLQLTAARMAGLHRLVFHVGAQQGRAPLADALTRVREELATTMPVSEVVAHVEGMGFQWGASDGN